MSWATEYLIHIPRTSLKLIQLRLSSIFSFSAVSINSKKNVFSKIIHGCSNQSSQTIQLVNRCQDLTKMKAMKGFFQLFIRWASHLAGVLMKTQQTQCWVWSSLDEQFSSKLRNIALRSWRGPTIQDATLPDKQFSKFKQHWCTRAGVNPDPQQGWLYLTRHPLIWALMLTNYRQWLMLS